MRKCWPNRLRALCCKAHEAQGVKGGSRTERELRKLELAIFQVILNVRLVALLAYPFLPLLVGLALPDRLTRREALAVLRHVLLSSLQDLRDVPAERRL